MADREFDANVLPEELWEFVTMARADFDVNVERWECARMAQADFDVNVTPYALAQVRQGRRRSRSPRRGL